MAKTKRMVVVTTDVTKKGVFFGELIRHNEKAKVAELANAQMAVYWSAVTRGVLGLASIGPQKGSRITPIVPKITLDGVTSVIDATQEAVKLWKNQPWG